MTPGGKPKMTSLGMGSKAAERSKNTTALDLWTCCDQSQKARTMWCAKYVPRPPCLAWGIRQLVAAGALESRL